jgi:hypothetical protein
MLIKKLTVHSLIYILGLTSFVAVPKVISLPNSPAVFQSDTRQIANRSAKTDRLPIRQLKPQANDKGPLHMPGQIAPNPKIKGNCKPPIDVLGRCFADAMSHNVT